MCGNFHQPVTAGCTVKIASVPYVPVLTPEQLEQIGKEATEWAKAIHERTRHMSAIGPDYEIEQLKQRLAALENQPKMSSETLRWLRKLVLDTSRTRDLKVQLQKTQALVILENLIREADIIEKNRVLRDFSTDLEKIQNALISKVVAVVKTARSLVTTFHQVAEKPEPEDIIQIDNEADTVLDEVEKLEKALKDLDDDSGKMSDPQ